MPPHSVRSVQDRSVAMPVIAEPVVPPPILCFSHLRWDFVYQRPQHLMSRFADSRRVYFVEEPIHRDSPPRLDVNIREHGVRVAVPILPPAITAEHADSLLQQLLDDFLSKEHITSFVAWYYTPMANSWTHHLQATVVVYDCMDELSLFQSAPAELIQREKELLRRADVVFTGGTSLYEAKRTRHSNVHCFPSSIDR